MTVTTLRAGWVFPVDQPPIRDGIIQIEAGKIASVGAYQKQLIDQHWPDACITPGLVNAHVHLDLTGLRGKIAPPAPGKFTDWLKQVIAHRMQTSTEATRVDIEEGIAESLEHGVTMVGDISAGGQSWKPLQVSTLRSTAYYEMLGLTEASANRSLSQLQAWLSDKQSTSHCQLGLSPHAPYSVRRELFLAIASVSQNLQLPVTTHMAETAEELQLLATHNGPFLDFLQSLNVWDASGLVTSIEEVLILLQATTNLSLAHGNLLEARHHQTLLPRTVVYCPRTHAYFQRGPHPYRQLLEAGVAVALGTDGLSSNPDLNIFAEALFLRQQDTTLESSTLLSMITLNGAKALGRSHELGSITPGKLADLTLHHTKRMQDDPWQTLWEETASRQRI